MKQTIGFSQFTDAFRDMGRKDQFTYEGKRALFDHLEDIESDTGEEIELDVIALCCDYTEYESLAELQKDCPDIKDMDDLEEHTTVIPVSGESFIIQQY